MRSKKIAVIIGVRPNCVKLSALLAPLQMHHTVNIIATGQHYDFNLFDVFFDELGLPEPTHRLDIGSGSTIQQLSRIIIKLEEIFVSDRPDFVLVWGDATSSLGGGLAAAKMGIPLAHMEAGARNYDLNMQEEINRLLIDSVSTLYFSSTQNSLKELKKRGINSNTYFVGDLLLDAVIKHLPEAVIKSDIPKRMNLVQKEYILVTIHRAENTNRKELTSLVNGLCQYKGDILFPVHPRTRKALEDFGLMELLRISRNIKIAPPLSYYDMLIAMKNAKVIVSDSNGVQREAYFLGVPCLIPRNSTEYPETIENGCASLISSPELSKLNRTIDDILLASGNFDNSLFGSGDAGHKISSILRDFDNKM